MSTRNSIATFVLLCGSMLACASVMGEVDQQAIARDLAGQDREARDQAFYVAGGIETSQLTPELREALIGLPSRIGALTDRVRHWGRAVSASAGRLT